jgi:GT2 family glycosyltransferase
MSPRQLSTGEGVATRASGGRATDYPAVSRLSIAVVMATIGRPHTCLRTINRLAAQSRRPDRVLVVGVSPADIAELSQAEIPVEAYLGPKGSCHQRNHALAILRNDADLVLFIDDDFVPAERYLANAEALFREHPDVVGATGRIIADGAKGRGLSFEQAEAMIAADSAVGHHGAAIRPRRALYGCNMVLRATAIADLRFDENLPLYAWQEDIDFSYRVGEKGRLVDCAAMAGVHMGEKAGRTSGRRLGYSQVANPIYLLRKGTIDPEEVWRVMPRNVTANLVRSLKPEPWIDRRGRLFGNILAFRDHLTGRLHPRRILEMR